MGLNSSSELQQHHLPLGYYVTVAPMPRPSCSTHQGCCTAVQNTEELKRIINRPDNEPEIMISELIQPIRISAVLLWCNHSV